MLKKSENEFSNQMKEQASENDTLEKKALDLERNSTVLRPVRLKDKSEQMENLSTVLKAKDSVIDQLLSEISLVKNEKDDL